MLRGLSRLRWSRRLIHREANVNTVKEIHQKEGPQLRRRTHCIGGKDRIERK